MFIKFIVDFLLVIYFDQVTCPHYWYSLYRIARGRKFISNLWRRWSTWWKKEMDWLFWRGHCSDVYCQSFRIWPGWVSRNFLALLNTYLQHVHFELHNMCLQVLAEDPLQNRMIESLNLFEGICNLSWFCNVAMILFLNKNDIFMVLYNLVAWPCKLNWDLR